MNNSHLQKNNLIFTGITVAFALDAVVNKFTDLPLFVLSLPIFCIVLLTYHSSPKKIVFAFFSVVLIVSTAFKLIFSTTDQTDLADLFSLIFCVISFNHFINHPPSIKTLKFNGLIFAGLFLPAFLGVNYVEREFASSTSGVDLTANLEFFREYKTGFFRVAHVAAYVLFLYFILYSKEFSERRNLVSLVLLGLYITGSILAGSRTPIFALALSILIFYTTRSIKTIPIGIVLVTIFAYIVLNINSVLAYAAGTPIFQYLTFIKTTIENKNTASFSWAK